MKTALTIEDPLAGQAVTIIITLPASEQATDQRQALVSVGVAAQALVSKSGVFGRLPDLITEAWKAFGVQAEAAQAQAEGAETAVMPDLIAEAETEPDNLTTAAPVTTAPRPAANPKPSAPKPAANLGLF